MFSPVSVRCADYLLSGLANPEDEDEQTGWEQFPYEEDGTKDQVATVAQFISQVSLQTNKHSVICSVLAFLLAMAINFITMNHQHLHVLRYENTDNHTG